MIYFPSSHNPGIRPHKHSPQHRCKIFLTIEIYSSTTTPTPFQSQESTIITLQAPEGLTMKQVTRTAGSLSSLPPEDPSTEKSR